MVNWINKVLTHNRDKVGDFGIRTVIHIPVGFIIGLTFPLSYPLLTTLHKYEENEDLHTKDQAWKDYFGVMVGEALGVVCLITTIMLWVMR